MAELVETLRAIGFENVRITNEYHCFEGTSKEGSARHFGVTGVDVYAAKPARA